MPRSSRAHKGRSFTSRRAQRFKLAKRARTRRTVAKRVAATGSARRSKVAHPQRGLTSSKHNAILRYSAELNFDPTGPSTLLNTHKWRANGMFDPYEPLGGHQPNGFDQYMTFYERFTVTYATIKVTLFPNMVEDTLNQYQFVLQRYAGNNTDVTNANDAIEQPDSIWKYVGGASSKAVVLTDRVNIGQALSTNVMDEITCSGTASGDPSPNSTVHWCVGGISTGFVGDPAPIKGRVEITYHATFHNPVQLGGS